MAATSMPAVKGPAYSNEALGLFKGEVAGTRSFSGYEPKRLFHQLPTGAFEECAFVEGFDSRADGRSLVAADLDGDGDQDLVLLNRNEPVLQVFRNDGPPGRALEVTLRGKHGTREAAGATVLAGGRAFPVVLARGYVSAVDPTVHVGLGEQAGAAVSVRWPSGEVESFGTLAAGSRYVLEQGTPRPLETHPFTSSPGTAALPPLVLGSVLPGESGPVVVPLVASWCKGCYAEVAALNRIRSGKWKLRGLAFEPLPQARKLGALFPLQPASDAVEKVLEARGLGELPMSLVFAEDGTLRRVLRGTDHVEQALAQLH